MYDSLLDHDLEDETTVVSDVASDLDDKPLDEDEEDTDSLTVDDEVDPAETLEGQEIDAESLFGVETANLGPTIRFACISRKWVRFRC